MLIAHETLPKLSTHALHGSIMFFLFCLLTKQNELPHACMMLTDLVLQWNASVPNLLAYILASVFRYVDMVNHFNNTKIPGPIPKLEKSSWGNTRSS